MNPDMQTVIQSLTRQIGEKSAELALAQGQLAALAKQAAAVQAENDKLKAELDAATADPAVTAEAKAKPKKADAAALPN